MDKQMVGGIVFHKHKIISYLKGPLDDTIYQISRLIGLLV